MVFSGKIKNYVTCRRKGKIENALFISIFYLSFLWYKIKKRVHIKSGKHKRKVKIL